MNQFTIHHKSGQTLALGVDEETTRRILRNVGPCACSVSTEAEPDESLNGTEWIIDNPGTP